MDNIYIALESFSALVVLFLLYTNLFETKEHTKKRKRFNYLLIACEAVLLVDLITWFNFNWEKIPALFYILNSLTYIIPCTLFTFFSFYIYEHISERAKIRRTPFNIMFFISAISGITALIFCISGKMFHMEDGKFAEGPLVVGYYILFAVCLLYCFFVILFHYKKLGTHDLIACLFYPLFPLITLVISILDICPVNLTIPSIGFIVLVIYILLENEHANKLFDQSNMDELTKLFNRRAYEDDMMNFPDVPPEQDFIYACIDINGLKQVNDTLGHLAGDELICGASYCLKRVFGNHGKVYRVGGDEFVAIFFADETKFEFLKEDIENITTSWSGQMIKSISISVGYASKKEFQKETVAEMSQIAEKRMYEEKELFYTKKGFDRRGQNQAFKTLCSLYTKILKINITTDTSSIVSADPSEINEGNGYSEKISEWFINFAKNGGVMEDDIEEFLAKTNLDYMRDYFKRGKTSLTISYHRRFNDGYKYSVMEIIPAGDYTEENQSLYLYVKNIDI